MTSPSVQYSYASRTLFITVKSDTGEQVFTLARPMWTAKAAWACQPAGAEPYGTSEAFPTATVSRLLDDHVGVLASEVIAHRLEEKTLHACTELLKEFSLIEGELAVSAANRVCAAYNGRIESDG